LAVQRVVQAFCQRGGGMVVKVAEPLNTNAVKIWKVAGFRNHNAVAKDYTVSSHGQAGAFLATGGEGNGKLIRQL
jgi:hypothetical protein